MNPALAAGSRGELEVLDGVGRVGLRRIEPGVADGTVEKLSGRADERLSASVLDVTGLLAHEHEPRRDRSLAENGLRRVAVEVAATAAVRSRSQAFEPDTVGHELRGTHEPQRTQPRPRYRRRALIRNGR